MKHSGTRGDDVDWWITVYHAQGRGDGVRVVRRLVILTVLWRTEKAEKASSHCQSSGPGWYYIGKQLLPQPLLHTSSS